MNGIDILLQQSIIAAFFWVIAVIFTQQKWHILDTFFGKKYARLIVRALFILVWLQVVIVGLLSLRSSWQVQPMLVFGTLLIAWAIYMLFTRRQTPFTMPRSQSFWASMRQHIPFMLLFLGLGYATGGLGILVGALTYSVCAVIQTAVLSRLVANKK